MLGVQKEGKKKEKKEEKKGDSDREGSGGDEEEDEDVTFEDKVAFTEKVRRLTNEGLTRLVKKIKEKCKEALEDVDAEKLHIQVDKIDKESFEVLSKLVDDNLVKSKNANKR